MNILILWINLPTKSMINSIQRIIDETSIPVFKKKIICIFLNTMLTFFFLKRLNVSFYKRKGMCTV